MTAGVTGSGGTDDADTTDTTEIAETAGDDTGPTLARVFVYPVKSLDAHRVERATVREAGGLSYDREFAVFDADGEDVNGKREPRVYRLRSTFDPAGGTLAVREHGTDEERVFSLADRGDPEPWLADYLGYEVTVRRDERVGFPDDTHAAGPTVVSTGTLDTVASWFDLPNDDVRRRLRPDPIVRAPAGWEDRHYSANSRDRVVPFEVGGATLEGVNPCQRCAVPTRDPDRGEGTPGFRERFVEMRRETLPEWAGDAWYDHHFRLMVNTRPPWNGRERGGCRRPGSDRRGAPGPIRGLVPIPRRAAGSGQRSPERDDDPPCEARRVQVFPAQPSVGTCQSPSIRRSISAGSPSGTGSTAPRCSNTPARDRTLRTASSVNWSRRRRAASGSSCRARPPSGAARVGRPQG